MKMIKDIFTSRPFSRCGSVKEQRDFRSNHVELAVVSAFYSFLLRRLTFFSPWIVYPRLGEVRERCNSGRQPREAFAIPLRRKCVTPAGLEISPEKLKTKCYKHSRETKVL